jgi:8-oxo-dGTP pyrophosphatase MutT (NUDIX family)
MLGDRVFKEYPDLRRIIEDIDARFIISLDQKVLMDSKMIFFKIQKAFWYYKDKYEKLIKDRKIPSMPLDLFGQLLIEASQVLSRVYPHELRALKYKEWQDYLRRVPRLGAICLNPTADKVLMIQPFGRNRRCLQFPRGKLHAGEDHARAAAREVWEECGIRIENLMDPSVWFEAHIDQTLHKLYMVFPVMEELVPSIQCNKEIEQVLWVPLASLPGYASVPYDDRQYFGVAPFVPQIKDFLRKQGKPILRIMKRSEDLYEEDKEDPRADRLNSDTFPDEDPGWSFDDMVRANAKLGVTSTYSETAFEQQFSTGPVSGLHKGKILEAFRAGWNS